MLATARRWGIFVALWLVGSTAAALAKPTNSVPAPWDAGWDSGTLPQRFHDVGYDPGPDFKVVVVEVQRAADHVAFQWFDYKGTGAERDTWWPASTVKLPMAVAALERIKAWGFSTRASITFQYERGPVTQSIKRLIRRALIPSDNHAYDRLGEIVGFDHLNRHFLTPAKGFWTAVMQRGYSGRVKDEATGRGSLRHSSALVVSQGAHEKEIKERFSDRDYDCPNHGNCFTLAEFAETMRRVMFHELLPKSERFRLGKSHLKLLREALGAQRPRGNGVVDGLRAGFSEVPIEVWHKPGFALDWFSDVVYLKAADGREWIVAMANHPGRDSCDEPARQLGALLARGPLAPPPPVEPRSSTPTSSPDPTSSASPANPAPAK